MAQNADIKLTSEGRLLSLDFFRGFTMFLLVAEWTHIYSYLTDPQLSGTIISAIGTQFHHHPWNGLRFWDLVQPYFMFIVGVAIPFSVKNRLARGDSYSSIRRHAIQRAFLLLFFGWALYCIGPGRITFRFQNVLAQLSVTYIIAFFLMKRSVWTQIIVSFLLIGITELLYRGFPLEGFNQPWVGGKNFGAWVDFIISGRLPRGRHWANFNAIPTTAHTIWGVLAGQLLLSKRSDGNKLKILIITGVLGVVVGYSLNPITPIIKRICTSSFVIVSGGWTLLSLAFCYWLIDIMKIQKWAKFAIIVGMNPLFIYLFCHAGGGQMVYDIVKPFTMDLLSWTGELTAKIITALVTLYLLWYITYWMYKRKIFIRI